MREAHTEALVVGAGPVGLWTALLLAEAGVQVILLDRESHTASRSYACGIHPRTLKLLARLGLAEAVLEHGRRIPKLAFYEGTTRQAELDFSQLGHEFPFVVILPQSTFERLLEERLSKAGVNVHWNHRFADFMEEEEQLAVRVEELGGTGTGYIIPHWEMTVKHQSIVRSQLLIGTDGHSSTVRAAANIDYQQLGDPQVFAAFEFESDDPGEDELRVALGDTTNVLWPLPGNRFRWTFQLLHHELPVEFPEKERRAARLSQPQVDEKIARYVQKVSSQRAPWFSAKVKTIAWCSEVVFEKRLVSQFGRNRCWLAGDAAHQTGPGGIQSMNVGFLEAESLVNRVKNVLRYGGPMDSVSGYDAEQMKRWRIRWRILMGLTGGLKSKNDTSPWARANCDKLLPCLPGCDEELADLARQLHLHIG